MRGDVDGRSTRAVPTNEAARIVRAVVVDHGAGNLVSIGQALVAVGAEARLATSPAELEPADLLVLPGVGAAAPAMARLNERDLAGPIRRWIEADRPFLGICLGLQLLFDGSDEDGASTLRVVPGRAILLEQAPTLPHIGWNQVVRRREHPLFDGIADGADFYFVHSFAGRPAPTASEWILAETSHGGPFVSAVARGNRLGVQFHPERSGPDGLRLLANVVALAAASRDAGPDDVSSVDGARAGLVVV
jgi:imidazole glycerol phosphate synthase glutamine amidotransferase subunit